MVISMITSLSNLIENTYIRYTRNQQDMYLLMESIVAATTVFKKSETIYTMYDVAQFY